MLEVEDRVSRQAGEPCQLRARQLRTAQPRQQLAKLVQPRRVQRAFSVGGVARAVGLPRACLVKQTQQFLQPPDLPAPRCLLVGRALLGEQLQPLNHLEQLRLEPIPEPCRQRVCRRLGQRHAARGQRRHGRRGLSRRHAQSLVRRVGDR